MRYDTRSGGHRVKLAPFVVTLFVMLSAASAPAQSPARVVVSTGREGASYFSIGTRLAEAMKKQHGREVEVLPSAGSVENLVRLHDRSSPVNVGLTQTDALKRYLAREPAFADAFFVLSDVGRECVFLVSGRTGPIASMADFKKAAGLQLSVGGAGGGAAVTWQDLTQIEPALRATKAVNVETMEALLQIRTGGQFTKVAAAMLVQRPRVVSPPLRAVISNPQDYRFVPIVAGDIGEVKLPDGSAVYTFDEVAVGGRLRASPTKVQTLCTRGLMIGVKAKLDRDLRERLSTLMLEQGTRIVGADE